MLRRVCVYCALFCAAEINQASMSAIRNYAYYFTFSCALLVTATYKLMSVGGNTEINTENMSRGIKIFRGKVILLVTRARSP